MFKDAPELTNMTFIISFSVLFFFFLKWIIFLELMETSIVHTRPDTSKIDPFNETFFKRWQERVYSTIDVVNLWHILTEPKPKSDSEDLYKWENGNKQVRHAILTTLTNELFDVYCQYKVAK